MRKHLSKGIFLLLLLSFIGGCIKAGKEGITIALTPNQIDSFLKKQFPIKEELKLGTLYLKDPNVASIDEKGKINIGLAFDYKVSFFPAINGNFLVAGGLKYNPEKMAIFLKEPQIKDFQLLGKKIPSLLSSETKNIISGVVSAVFETVPIYRFDKKSIYGRFVKDIKVKNGKIYITFGL